MKKLSILIVTIAIFSAQGVLAGGYDDRGSERFDRKNTYKPEIVSWTGVIHSVLDDEVDLEFVRSEDKEDFDIVDSPNLEKLDWKNHRSRLVKITAEKTPRFLFWGGSLIVKDFIVVKETGKFPMPKRKTASADRRFGTYDRR